MKKLAGFVIVAAIVGIFVGVAGAQMGWGMGPCGPGMMGPGMMGGYMGPGMMGPGMMGPGMMGHGGGWYGYPGTGSSGQAAATVDEPKAKELAQSYANQYLQGFTVDKVLPFSGMGGMTMYSVELKGPKDEVRTLHVNPWGQVMPFGGPWRRG